MQAVRITPNGWNTCNFSAHCSKTLQPILVCAKGDFVPIMDLGIPETVVDENQVRIWLLRARPEERLCRIFET